MSLKVVGPNYVLRVIEGAFPLRLIGKGELQVGLELLRLDAEAGVAGESIASLLLPALDYDDELSPLVEDYRRRVVIEEAANLSQRFSATLRRVLVPPAYFPLARMSAHSLTHSCYFNLREGQLDEIGELYRPYLNYVGYVEGDSVRVSTRKVRGSLGGVLSSFVKTALSSLGAAGLYLWMGARTCKPNRLLEDP
ncbi:MAG: hypothetical protein ACP5HK_06215, partial [Acidilobus sp.]